MMRMLHKVGYWAFSIPAVVILLAAWGMQILAEWTVAVMYWLEGPPAETTLTELMDDDYASNLIKTYNGK